MNKTEEKQVQAENTTASQVPEQQPAQDTKKTSNEPAVNPNAIVYANQGFIQETRKKLNNWYNNLSFVKKQREAEEAKLVPLVLEKDGRDSIKYDTKQIWDYVARDKDGKIVRASLSAYSKMDVYSFLMDDKYTVYSIELSKQGKLFGSSSFSNTKIKTKDLVFWLTQLSTYIKAGIPLTDAVRVLTKQNKNKNYNKIYDSIVYELTMGQPFSEALERQGNAFPPLLVNMVKSAEMTGEIENTLDDMANYYQEVEDLKKAIISALAYPCVVMVVAIIILVFMLTYIVPQFVSVFESMKAEIPAITKFTLALSEFIQTKYGIIIAAVIIIVVTYMLLYKKIKAFRSFMQSIFMKLPVVGKIIISKEISMFARTFSALQKNNVLLTDSIEILAKITSNEIYKELEYKTVENLIKGNKMSETFKDHWAIPDIAYFMILTGESTGELAEMLERVADFYSKEEKTLVGMIKTFIEPLMLILLAVIVGFILISILVPMFGMYSTVA